MHVTNIKARQLRDHLCFAIYACSREITKLYRPFLEPLGLTYPQYLVLVALSDSGAITVKELGDQLYLDSGTLTPLLKRMQEADLVHRARSADDERKVIISLTSRGQEVRNSLLTMPECLGKSVADQYGGDLRSLLTEVTELLQTVHALNQS